MSPARRAAVAALVAAAIVAAGVLAVSATGGLGAGQPLGDRVQQAEGSPLAVRFGGPDRVLGDSRDEEARHHDLELTSGRLLARGGHAWTDSPVFRARTRRADFGDAVVRLRVRNDRLSTSDRTPARDFDGISIGVRYASPDELYYVNVVRRDGTVTIKRKTPSGVRGRYSTLASTDRATAEDRWERVEVRVQTGPDAVVIAVSVDGADVLRAEDDREGDALLRPGRVLVRGDNSRFAFDDLEVLPLRRRAH